MSQDTQGWPTVQCMWINRTNEPVNELRHGLPSPGLLSKAYLTTAIWRPCSASTSSSCWYVAPAFYGGRRKSPQDTEHTEQGLVECDMQQNRKTWGKIEKVKTQARNLTPQCHFNAGVCVLVVGIISGREVARGSFHRTEALTETVRDQEFHADSSTIPASWEKANPQLSLPQGQNERVKATVGFCRANPLVGNLVLT